MIAHFCLISSSDCSIVIHIHITDIAGYRSTDSYSFSGSSDIYVNNRWEYPLHPLPVLMANLLLIGLCIWNIEYTARHFTYFLLQIFPESLITFTASIVHYMRSYFFFCILYLLPFILFAQQTDTTVFKNTITLQYDYFHFDKQFTNDWHIAGLEYKHEAKSAALLARFNYANRLAKNGWQAELEAYPRFSKKVYSYAGIGYSPNMPVFPKFRAGYSLYVNLPKAIELEGGFRYLYFNRDVWVGVAGIGYYTGNWFLQARSFLSDNNGFNFAGIFTARRYFGEMNDYAWLQVGTGVSPDETRNIQFTTNQRLYSNRITIGIRKSIQRKHLLLFHTGYSRDEYQPKIFGNQYFGSIGYARRF